MSVVFIKFVAMVTKGLDEKIRISPKTGILWTFLK